MSYDFAVFKQHLAEAEEWLQKEYHGIRTGRATPAILDGVQVEAYGSKMPINQLAHITTEDAQSLRITPWDTSQIKDVERAIEKADLGVSVNVDDKGVRVIFPELTSERREQLTKLIKNKREEALVSTRKAREDVWDDIRTQKKEGTISEDDMYRFKEEMEKLVQSAQDNLKAREEKKIIEIST